ncbi:MAG: BrnA antitoxin family protein [Verrucomicrobia bacterium]|jgi:hypothetical protein|nr:BrnA antitoxin family protein [Verrucomicrobiota bacterium]
MAEPQFQFQGREAGDSRPPVAHIHPIKQWEEVPFFQDEIAEAAYWSMNRLSVGLMESSAMGSKSSPGESVTISLRIDAKMLARIKRMARTRFLNYQSMMKQWLAERMEQELPNNPGE